jgi:hypothetical protein
MFFDSISNVGLYVVYRVLRSQKGDDDEEDDEGEANEGGAEDQWNASESGCVIWSQSSLPHVASRFFEYVVFLL